MRSAWLRSRSEASSAVDFQASRPVSLSSIWFIRDSNPLIFAERSSMVAVISVSNLLALRGARSSELAELKKNGGNCGGLALIPVVMVLPKSIDRTHRFEENQNGERLAARRTGVGEEQRQIERDFGYAIPADDSCRAAVILFRVIRSLHELTAQSEIRRPIAGYNSTQEAHSLTSH